MTAAVYAAAGLGLIVGIVIGVFSAKEPPRLPESVQVSITLTGSDFNPNNPGYQNIVTLLSRYRRFQEHFAVWPKDLP